MRYRKTKNDLVIRRHITKRSLIDLSMIMIIAQLKLSHRKEPGTELLWCYNSTVFRMLEMPNICEDDLFIYSR